MAKDKASRAQKGEEPKQRAREDVKSWQRKGKSWEVCAADMEAEYNAEYQIESLCDKRWNGAQVGKSRDESLREGMRDQ